jgi:hypothetical protein
MAETTYIREAVTGMGFVDALVGWLEEHAGRRDELSLSKKQDAAHVSTLHALAGHIRRLPRDRDRDLVALFDINQAMAQARWARGEQKAAEGARRFQPGPLQSRFLAVVGSTGKEEISPEEALSELLVAGVLDLKNSQAADTARWAKATKGREDEIADLRSQLEVARARIAELDIDTGALAAVTEERDEALALQAESAELLEHRKPPSRRTRLDGEVGVYTNPSGTFEALVADGKFKVFQTLDEARQARAEAVEQAKDASPPRDQEAELDEIEEKVGRELTEEEVERILADPGEDIVERWAEELAKSTTASVAVTEEVT